MRVFRELINLVIYGDIPTKTLIRRGLRVGRNFKRQNKTIIDKSHCNLITIGDDVTMAPRSYILAHDASSKKYTGFTKIAKVIIGDRVFIGAGAIILPGVTIGNDVIIGAGSVVTKDVENGSVVAGSPAHVVMRLSDFIQKTKMKQEKLIIKNEEIEKFIVDEKQKVAYIK